MARKPKYGVGRNGKTKLTRSQIRNAGHGGVRTPAQKAALIKAQRRSAELRRNGAGKHGSQSFYGKGRKGRKASRHSTYGKKRDGLSIAQQQRRRQRSNKRKRVIGAAVAGGVLAVKAHHIYKTNPDVNRSVNHAAKAAKRHAKAAKVTYKVNRQMGVSKTKSARAARPKRKRR